MSNFAVFRNKLAHEYLVINEEETTKHTKEIIESYPKYLKLLLLKIKDFEEEDKKD